jgi:hypothetical protein
VSSLAVCLGSNITSPSGWHSWASTDLASTVVSRGGPDIATRSWAMGPPLEFVVDIVAAFKVGDLGRETPCFDVPLDGIKALVLEV